MSQLPTIRLGDVSIYTGRNIHCGFPAIAGGVECVPVPSADTIAAAQRSLIRLLPELASAEFVPAPDLSSLASDAPAALGATLAWLTAQLQNLGNGCVSEVGISRAAAGGVIALSGYQIPEVAAQAMQLATALIAACCAAVVPALESGLQQSLDGFLELARSRHFDVQTHAVVSAARARNIPHYRLCSAARFVQLGQGVHLQHIYETVSDRTSEAGAKIAHNKVATNQLLRNVGVPVPAQIAVTTFEQAAAAAEQFGYPVVVKPTHGLQTRGVTVGVKNARELMSALQAAAGVRLGGVLVEKFVPGYHHRLTVIDGRLVTAVKWIPAHVVGDGVHTVEELIAIVNRAPRRGDAHGYAFDFGRQWARLAPNPEMSRMLNAQDYGYSSVPPPGRIVRLHGTATVASGGDGVDVTDQVHPEVREMAELIARAFKLDTVGVDYLTDDVAHSYRNDGGAVCEVNACPGFQGHFLIGVDREKILDALLQRDFPAGQTGRVPVVAIAESARAGTVARMVAHLLEASGKTTALAYSGGVTISTRRIRTDDSAGGERARAVMFDPRVEAAVLELSCASLLATGMPVDSCDVGAILEVDGAHRRRDGVTTVDEWGALKSLVTQSASRYAVLNADDANCVSIAARLLHVPICWVSARADNLVVKSHRDANGMTVTIEGEGGDAAIVMAEGAQRQRIATLRDLVPVENAAARTGDAMFAVAIACALGLAHADIQAGLATFRDDRRVD